jgi:hypothetical protein
LPAVNCDASHVPLGVSLRMPVMLSSTYMSSPPLSPPSPPSPACCRHNPNTHTQPPEHLPYAPYPPQPTPTPTLPRRYLGLLEGRNPYALAHFANHPGKGMTPNTVVASFAVRLGQGQGQGQGPELRAYLPNMMFSPEGASHQRLLEEEVCRGAA